MVVLTARLLTTSKYLLSLFFALSVVGGLALHVILLASQSRFPSNRAVDHPSFGDANEDKHKGRRNSEQEITFKGNALLGKLDKMEYPTWKDDCKSALRRHLTPEVFEQLKSVSTSRGVTLKDIINSGVVNQDSSIGVYLGDEESYTAFSPLVNPIIEEYHKGHKVMIIMSIESDPKSLSYSCKCEKKSQTTHRKSNFTT